MVNETCLKCEAIKAFVQKQRDKPPVMDFQIEKPFYDILDDIQAILDSKTILEQAYKEAKHTGRLKRLLKLRKEQL